MRADAQANRDRLLTAAGPVLAEHGADASMRDIARRAGVGLATLLRHFPTREALLEALLRTSFDALTARAAEVEADGSPQEALMVWLREFVAFTTDNHGVVTSMVKAIEEPESELHASCVALKAAGARLLTRAQAADAARSDVDGADLFALVSALAWLGDQPGHEARAKRLFDVVMGAIVTDRAA
ncbi:TetR/AcrR family transcriptional regulator [Amycolatopsis sp. SID8362]|uniref:TetR/AcrR family transcriptional regulator n=1 Tax=Amycolatopsis sp. SID8362 TaxID=2690346 RepID=UPI001367ABA5|nr:TetR/AcrR family transcriptional regulator [Amycolatopsis sp. SID8362]NBH12136.1 TetR family transcriptional regulator [Amycolatopsis sp. SID8362]NED48828.1 TetR/AcrR family transcriptional regulator [Amycolatopsis sp. SID8362]